MNSGIKEETMRLVHSVRWTDYVDEFYAKYKSGDASAKDKLQEFQDGINLFLSRLPYKHDKMIKLHDFLEDTRL